MSAVLSNEQCDAYEAITGRIIEAIEAGADRFIMPWHGRLIAQGRPRNASTNFVYRGINIVSLWAEASLQGFSSSSWASQAQWRRMGRRVVSNEKGALVVFYKLLGEEVDECGEHPPQAQWLVKLSRVFNEDQLEDRSFFGPPPTPLPLIEAEAQAVVLSTRARIEHGHRAARYRTRDDVIELPDRSTFTDSPMIAPLEGYYAHLFGALASWTGADSRLNRDLSARFGELAPAAEALVSELAGALICANVEVTNVPRSDRANDVADWLKILRRDNRAMFAISQMAREAAHYVLRFSERKAVAA